MLNMRLFVIMRIFSQKMKFVDKYKQLIAWYKKKLGLNDLNDFNLNKKIIENSIL